MLLGSVNTYSRLVTQPNSVIGKNVFTKSSNILKLITPRNIHRDMNVLLEKNRYFSTLSNSDIGPACSGNTFSTQYAMKNKNINNTSELHLEQFQKNSLRLYSHYTRVSRRDFHKDFLLLEEQKKQLQTKHEESLKELKKEEKNKNTEENSKENEPKTDFTEDPKAGHKELLRLFKLAKYDWKLLSLALSLLFISCVIGMSIPKVIGIVLDVLKESVSKTTDINDIMIFDMISLPNFLMLFAASLIIGQMCSFGRIVLLRVLGEKLVSRLRSKVMKTTMHQDAEFFDRNKVGDLISRLGSDAYVVSRSITQNISDGCKAILCGGIGIGMMFQISTSLSAAVFIFAPLLMIGASIYGKKIRVLSKNLQMATGNLTRVAEEQLSSVKTVQSFVAESKELGRYNNSIKELFKVGKKEAIANATFFSSTNILSDMSFLIVLAYGSHLALQGTMSIGDLTAFMLYTEFTGNAVYGLSNFYSELMKGAGAASRLFELTDRKPLIHSTKGESFVNHNNKDSGACTVKVEDLTFAYPTRPNNQIFKNLNFEIEKGSNVCIVGPSGRGKSTITSLLLKYYLPTTGRILIDDQDLSQISAKSIRRSLGVVQQEPILMSGSIKNNISYGLDYEPTMDEIRAVAKKAFCYDFIMKFPNGFETQIGPRGALLSGGQKQRISIARALMKKPKILILDEATSALDVESEGAINYTLGKMMRSRECTIISIAHRLSTIRRSENIIVLGDDGSVVEMGKFKELYANQESKLYKLLHEKKKSDTKNLSNKGKEEEKVKIRRDESQLEIDSQPEPTRVDEKFEETKESDIKKEVLEHIIEDIDTDAKSSKLTP